MSLEAVNTLQNRMVANQAGRKLKSSAIGRYQFIRKTLRSIRNAFGYSGDVIFSPQVQDKFAAYLLHKRGFDKWRAGKMSRSAFQNNLAKEWASIPTTRGQSYYGQGVGISNADLQKALDGALDRTPIGGYVVEKPKKVVQTTNWFTRLIRRIFAWVS
jgi:hypothetical protein